MTGNAAPVPPILYIVGCSFSPGAEKVAQRWLDWLRESHLAEVLAAGAVSAEIVRLVGPAEQYEIHYRFATEKEFALYERDLAPRLRADGLARFPLELGLIYERRVGVVIHRLVATP